MRPAIPRWMSLPFSPIWKASSWQQAVALYRGDLLAGFTCDSLPFDEWLRQEREQLHRLALDALFD